MISTAFSARRLRAHTRVRWPRYRRRNPTHDPNARHAVTWTNRVVWQEGMFLRAQHFQQQDRWLETLVRARSAELRSHPWGITEMAIDRDLLSTGRFALSPGSGG